MRGLLVAAAAGALLPCSESAANTSALKLPKWFGDNMVLQTNAEYGARSFINGMANPNEAVVVQVGKSKFPATADATGAWEVEVNHGAGDVTVTTASGEGAKAANAAGGDVFFCAGQSNMVFPMELTFNATEEMATLKDFPHISFFMTALDYAAEPLFDLRPGPSECVQANASLCAKKCAAPGMCNRWVTAAEAAANNNTFLKQFSATCFMTARDLSRMHTGKRPLGLVFSAWGGTRVEAWMSAEAVAAASKAVVPGKVIAPAVKPDQNHASALYNAMVAPFNPLAVRAALWYQGEANCAPLPAAAVADGATLTNYYAAYLQGMIADWRERKRMGDFTFMVMGLPPSAANTAGGAAGDGTGRPQVRLGQLEVVPHPQGLTDISGVATTLDLGGASAWGYDHPPNKNAMSQRLALQTVHAAYAVQGNITVPGAPNGVMMWTGPVLEGTPSAVAATAGSTTTVTLHFTNWSAVGLALGDVHAQNINGSDNSCTACCAGAPPFEVQDAATKAWARVPAAGVHVDASASTVSLTADSAVAGVRYGYDDFVQCVLVNSDGLPAAPFVAAVAADAAAGDHAKLAVSKPTAAAADAVALAPAPRIQSPPLGLNTWNTYHGNIDENIVKGLMDALVSNGMKDAGYSYVNIDDTWQVQRMPNGTIVPDPVRFPSGMRALSSYAHSVGLRFGLYTARGSGTCQSRPGSLNHEFIDAATYCDWQIDYIKIDRCEGAQDPQTSWTRFHQGLEECYNRTGREIVMSVESCDTPTTGCGLFVSELANLWRTSGDIQNTWASVMSNIHHNNLMAAVARPGHFNDPDMLQVGNVGLTLDEQRAHFSLWAVSGAPLLAGNDIIHASNETLAILTASEVLEVNQDLGVNGSVQGRLLPGSGGGGRSGSSGSDGDDARVGLVACTGDQLWDAVPAAAAASTTDSGGGAVHLVHRATGLLLAVPGCARAPLHKPFQGPLLAGVNATAASQCGGQDRLWTFQPNSTLTVGVDGQCANVWEGGGARRRNVDVQTFSCAQQAAETNGKWTHAADGSIHSSAFEGKCLAVGGAPAPSPAPAPSTQQVWAKPLSDGKRTAVVLLNTDDANTQDLTVTWAELGLPAAANASVRDLWQRKDLGTAQGQFVAKAVAPHSVVMITVAEQ